MASLLLYQSGEGGVMSENVRRCRVAIPLLAERSCGTRNEVASEELSDPVSPEVGEEGMEFLKKLAPLPRFVCESHDCYPIWISRWARVKGTKLLRGIKDEMSREHKTLSGKMIFEIVLETDGTVAIRLAYNSDSLTRHADSLAERFVNRARATFGEWPSPKEPVVFEAIFLL